MVDIIMRIRYDFTVKLINDLLIWYWRVKAIQYA